MTKFGHFLNEKSLSRTLIAQKSGLTKQRISELAIKESSKMRADELYMIALAISMEPGDLLEALYSELRNK